MANGKRQDANVLQFAYFSNPKENQADQQVKSHTSVRTEAAIRQSPYLEIR
jgi:hypothetical protein